MVWPFKKRVNEANPSERWVVGTAEDNGFPVIFRIRNAQPEDVIVADYPHLLAITWRYSFSETRGMPSQADSKRMALLEDLLEAALESTSSAFLTAVVTGNGVREWQWYASNPQAAMIVINEVLAKHDRFPIEFSRQDDPDWSAYKRLRNGFRSA